MTINIKDYFNTISDFPKKGIVFYDISPLLLNPAAWKYTVNLLSKEVNNFKPDILVALDARGFLLGSVIAYKLELGLTMVRKKGKLPGKVLSYSYGLEYGDNILEIQANAIKPNSKVLIVDDVLATGGTMSAAVKLLKSINVNPVAAICIMELMDLHGRNKLDIPVRSLVQF